jgi:hypothetical protein
MTKSSGVVSAVVLGLIVSLGPDARGAVFMRLRVTELNGRALAPDNTNAPLYNLGVSIRHHWPHPAGWQTGLPAWNRQPVGQWTPFVDIAGFIRPGTAAPWSSWYFTFDGVSNLAAELQFAPATNAAAVQASKIFRIKGNQALFRFMHNLPAEQSPQPPGARWSIWVPGFEGGLLGEDQLFANYTRMVDEAVGEAGLADSDPRPRRLNLFTGVTMTPDYRERMLILLRKLGLTWFPDVEPEMAARVGVPVRRFVFNVRPPHMASMVSRWSKDAIDSVKIIKLGDEIPTFSGITDMNGSNAAFVAYLKEQAVFDGLDFKTFTGVADEGQIAIPSPFDWAKATVPQRRIYYHAQRFAHHRTALMYAMQTATTTGIFPNAMTYCNYTPHKLIVDRGGSMNFADWFVVPRAGGQTLAWAEDWASRNRWHNGTLMCVSYYAALVACGARPRNLPSGFYIIVSMGDAARKIFSCLGQGVTWLHLYDWGALDRWAEASNAWSEKDYGYRDIALAAKALGPADALIADGKREPAQVALLYNRSEEIVQGDWTWAGKSRLWNFVALRAAGYPVDIIIEEDLVPEQLNRYRVLYLNGINVHPKHLAHIRRWVEAGGLLVTEAGAATRTWYDEPQPELEKLIGARPVGVVETDPTVQAFNLTPSDLTPQGAFVPGGNLRTRYEPTSAQVVGTYTNGVPCAVLNKVGRGQVLATGFQIGAAFAVSGGYHATNRLPVELVAWPVRTAIGRATAELSEPAAEVTVFDHPDGMALLLNDFSFTNRPAHLSVKPTRPVKQVVSTRHGRLHWEKVGDRIEIEVPPYEPVDVIILR